ncbi:MAG: energy transducer TonB [Marinilabiliaceae bacterium]|nr:energy transducer TonB [Marinilabiliaceae bacterium]
MKQYHTTKNGLLIIFFLIIFCYSTTQAENINSQDSIYTHVDKTAVFKGQPSKIEKFIFKNAIYPFQAWQNCIEGVVNVSFVVTKEGTLQNVIIENGTDPQLDEEAIRIVKMMTKWKPAIKNKEKVDSRVTIPVSFMMSLQEKQFAQTLKKYEFDENAPLYVIDNKIVETCVFFA